MKYKRFQRRAIIIRGEGASKQAGSLGVLGLVPILLLLHSLNNLKIFIV